MRPLRRALHQNGVERSTRGRSGAETMDGRPLRVAFVSHSAELDGGAERLLYELVTALAKNPLCESLVVVPGEGDLARALRGAGVLVALADYTWWCGPPRK